MCKSDAIKDVNFIAIEGLKVCEWNDDFDVLKSSDRFYAY